VGKSLLTGPDNNSNTSLRLSEIAQKSHLKTTLSPKLVQKLAQTLRLSQAISERRRTVVTDCKAQSLT
jgi:hypothetical protein